MTAAIICSELTFAWPDGVPVLSGLTVAFGPGRTGLIGVNGSGKSTLLRLIAGELAPGSGTVRTAGDVGYLPQAITLGTHRSVSDLLGITAARDALHAIEAGEVGEEVFGALGDNWNVEEQARAWLDRLGLASLGLDDRVERLSGGETILTALAALFLRRPDILLLDEPTNNLDLDARGRLYDAVASWTGVMVIVSHDQPEPVQPGPGPLLDVPVVPERGEDLLPHLAGLDGVQRVPDRGDAEQVRDAAARPEGDGLRQISDVPGGADGARSGGQLPGDQPEQGRFTRAVDPDQPGAAGPKRHGQAGQHGDAVGPGKGEL